MPRPVRLPRSRAQGGGPGLLHHTLGDRRSSQAVGGLSAGTHTDSNRLQPVPGKAATYCGTGRHRVLPVPRSRRHPPKRQRGASCFQPGPCWPVPCPARIAPKQACLCSPASVELPFGVQSGRGSRPRRSALRAPVRVAGDQTTLCSGPGRCRARTRFRARRSDLAHGSPGWG